MGPQKFQGFPQLLRAIPAKLLNRLNDLFPEEPPLRFLPELTRTRKRACNHNWKIICAAIEDETACSNTSAKFFRLVPYCRVMVCLLTIFIYRSGIRKAVVQGCSRHWQRFAWWFEHLREVCGTTRFREIGKRAATTRATTRNIH